MLFSARHRIAMSVCPELAWDLDCLRSEIKASNTAHSQIAEERDQAFDRVASLEHEVKQIETLRAELKELRRQHGVVLGRFARAAKAARLLFALIQWRFEGRLSCDEEDMQWFSDNLTDQELAWPADIPSRAPAGKDVA